MFTARASPTSTIYRCEQWLISCNKSEEKATKKRGGLRSLVWLAKGGAIVQKSRSFFLLFFFFSSFPPDVPCEAEIKGGLSLSLP